MHIIQSSLHTTQGAIFPEEILTNGKSLSSSSRLATLASKFDMEIQVIWGGGRLWVGIRNSSSHSFGFKTVTKLLIRQKDSNFWFRRFICRVVEEILDPQSYETGTMQLYRVRNELNQYLHE